MHNVDNLPENIASYAMHLLRSRTERELHDLIGAIEGDETEMEAWKLSEDDYFTAIEVAYFYPTNLDITIH